MARSLLWHGLPTMPSGRVDFLTVAWSETKPQRGPRKASVMAGSPDPAIRPTAWSPTFWFGRKDRTWGPDRGTAIPSCRMAIG